MSVVDQDDGIDEVLRRVERLEREPRRGLVFGQPDPSRWPAQPAGPQVGTWVYDLQAKQAERAQARMAAHAAAVAEQERADRERQEANAPAIAALRVEIDELEERRRPLLAQLVPLDAEIAAKQTEIKELLK